VGHNTSTAICKADERPWPQVEDIGPIPESLDRVRGALTIVQQTKSDAAMAEKSVAWWAVEISSTWQRAVESIIRTGKLLIEAKSVLGHGNFEVMIKTKLPFGPRTAERLMVIAHHPILANPNHGSLLPPSWRTLYELTQILDKTLLAKIEDGTIRPDLERKDVTKLRGNNAPVARKSKRRVLATITRTILSYYNRATPEDRADFLNLISLNDFNLMTPTRRYEIQKLLQTTKPKKSKLIEVTLAA
jgi:hypothetical protein